MRQISERFLAAIKLCVSSDPVKVRLNTAWTTQLEGIGISELPTQLRPEFRRLRDAMSAAKPQPHESAASASVRKMSAQQAAKHTARILQLSLELMHISQQADAVLQPDKPDDILIPGLGSRERLN